MPTPSSQVWEQVRGQASSLPAMYGRIDFELSPERYTNEVAEGSLRPEYARLKSKTLDPELVERLRAYSMMGDRVADAYAALIPQYGFRNLVSMLVQACDQGLDSVDSAPPELRALIQDMEIKPAWLDMELVEIGARLERNSSANVAPWAIRGGLISTFMNKYAAHPMAMTGTLSDSKAARRVKETANFFTTSVLPGALDRFGPGFKAAAMVRLMHSMVRFNTLRGPHWDSSVFGIPIPQVDQMPAGLTGSALLSMQVLRRGRKTFSRSERARIEFSRYRCFLLGLPEDLLADTPQGIIDTMAARQISLRAGYDDTTCGELLRATMSAKLAADTTLRSRITESFELSFSKLFFIKYFLSGDFDRAAKIGVTMHGLDFLRAIAVAVNIGLQVSAYHLASRTSFLSGLADRALIRKIHRQLQAYGHAEFTTDASTYKPSTAKGATK